MQETSVHMVELLGNQPGIYAVGFFVKNDQLYLGDQLPVRCEDKLYVTQMSQAHNAFDLLVTTIRQQSIAKAEVSRMDHAAGLHSIIWRQRTSAELERFDGVEEARKIPFIKRIDTYDTKRFLRPLRVMGMIYAQAPADTPLAEIKKSLDLAEKMITIVPREKGSSENELIRRYEAKP